MLELLGGEGHRVMSIPGDLRDEAFCQQLVSQAARELGGLDILVNNAARQRTRPSIDAISSADFDATMKTNVYAPFWLTRAAVAVMGPGGVIVNTPSEQAGNPSEDLVDYALTRAAVLNFTKSMAKQLAPKGIRVNAVAPGPFWTPLQVSGGATPEKLQRFGSQSFLGRPGQPAEIAGLYVAAADPSLSFSTGQIFGATGGDGQPAQGLIGLGYTPARHPCEAPNHVLQGSSSSFRGDGLGEFRPYREGTPLPIQLRRSRQAATSDRLKTHTAPGSSEVVPVLRFSRTLRGANPPDLNGRWLISLQKERLPIWLCEA